MTHNFFLAPRTALGSQALVHHALLHIHEGDIPLVQARHELSIAAELDLSSTGRDIQQQAESRERESQNRFEGYAEGRWGKV